MRILVADDDNFSRKILERHLEKWGHTVLSTKDGVEALEKIKADEEISMLITDWMMPKMNGLELCRKARKLERNRYLHITMLTAKGEKQDMLNGMEAGADAFLSKPFDAAELKAQIHVAERIIGLEKLLAQQLDDLTKAHHRIKEDLEASAQIQRSLLPQEPPEVEGIAFSWVFDSCDEVAGDTFNIFRLDEDHIGLYILDVSGHGVQAALLSVTLSRVLIPLPQSSGFLKRPIPTAPYYEILQPVEVTRELNLRFPVLAQSNQFFTFLYGILHLPTQTLTYSRAGHSRPIWVHEGKAETLAGGISPPIGLLDESEFDQQRIALSSGDLMVFYTDGINEAENLNREYFGEERMLKILAELSPEGIESAVRGLHQSVINFTGNAPQRDDITLLGFGLL